MAVYVDNMFLYKMGRYVTRGGIVMKMSHMMADTEEELHAMAQAIGVKRKWFQGDHYDICMAYRTRAIELGAIQVTMRELAVRRKKLRCKNERSIPNS